MELTEPQNSDTERCACSKYAVISPVRNEAKFIERTIHAMTEQTVPPSEWIIVDDGSTDETAEIADRYARDHSWLTLLHRDKREDKGDRQRGKGVIDTFYYGYDRLACRDYGFVVKMDGDVSFEPTYFEFLLRQFASDPKLGIAGGGLYEPVGGGNWELRSAPDHVSGPVKTYRRACFEEIGGLVSHLGWDGIDEWHALTLGWNVRSFGQLQVRHHRVMGKATGMLKSKIEQGYGAHYMGYHPLYTVARGISHIFRRPYFIGGTAMIAAQFTAWVQCQEQYPDPDVLLFVRRTQLRQLANLLVGKRVYKSWPSG
jgi:biofilm PGA synthesis N-glycosyltransferase PgaC